MKEKFDNLRSRLEMVEQKLTQKRGEREGEEKRRRKMK